jgi:hypothetical protein
VLLALVGAVQKRTDDPKVAGDVALGGVDGRLGDLRVEEVAQVSAVKPYSGALSRLLRTVVPRLPNIL